MSYSIRDILGHFIKPASRVGAACPHPCCKNRRPHPDHLPVMLTKSSVRKLSDAQLLRHADKPEVINHKHAAARVLKEMDRREESAARRAESVARRARRDKDRRGARAAEYQAYLEHEWIKAEAATNGYMLNSRGKVKVRDPRSLWTANDRTRAAYASDELREYWARHPPQTVAEFHAGRQQSRHRLYDIY